MNCELAWKWESPGDHSLRRMYLSWFSREIESIGHIIGKDLVELAYKIMEAEKSYNLPSVSWRPTKDSSVIQSKLEDLRSRSTKGRKAVS